MIKNANPLLYKKGKEHVFFLLLITVYFAPFFLVGQSLSAFISTAFQHVSSCGRRHSLAESVHFASLSFLGLIRSFHNLSPDFSISYFSLFLTLFARNPTITFLIIS